MVVHRMRSAGAAPRIPLQRATTGFAVWVACAAASALATEAPEPGGAAAGPESGPEPSIDVRTAHFDVATFAALVREPAASRLGTSPRLTLEGSVERTDEARPQALQGGVSTGSVDVSHRVWLGWGRAAFGVGIGAQTARLDQPLDTLQPPPLQPVRPNMSVGWRYSLTDSSSFYAGASAARAWGAEDGGLPSFRARAGVEWKTARSRLGFDGGRLGLQLDSGYRMSIRTRSGGVQIALRRTF